MAIYPLSLWIGLFKYIGFDWDLLIDKKAQKKSYLFLVTRFG